MTISAPASDFHSALALSRRQLMAAFTVAALSACGALLPLSAQAATVEESVLELQHDWEVVKYQTAGSEREKRYEALADKAHKISEAHAGRAEPLIWEGIIVVSWAGEKGGLGALSLAKKAKAMYEASIAIDASALDGSAYNSLGVLYYKVPGWPIGFGDKDKARDLIQKALAINPKGIELLLRRVPDRDQAPRRGRDLPRARSAGAAAPRPPDRRRRAPRGDPRAAREDQVALIAARRASTTFMPRPSARGLKVGSRPCKAAMRLTIDTPRPLPTSCWPAARWKRSPRREN